MTVEKSIKILKAVKMLKDDAIGTLIDTTEAYKMAIEALSKQCSSSEQADQRGNNTEMVDQFREATKKTEDVPDINVGKTDFKPGEKTEKIPYKKPEIIRCTECKKSWYSGTATINGKSCRIFKCSVWERPVSPFGFCYMAERAK